MPLTPMGGRESSKQKRKDDGIIPMKKEWEFWGIAKGPMGRWLQIVNMIHWWQVAELQEQKSGKLSHTGLSSTQEAEARLPCVPGQPDERI